MSLLGPLTSLWSRDQAQHSQVSEGCGEVVCLLVHKEVLWSHYNLHTLPSLLLLFKVHQNNIANTHQLCLVTGTFLPCIFLWGHHTHTPSHHATWHPSLWGMSLKLSWTGDHHPSSTHTHTHTHTGPASTMLAWLIIIIVHCPAPPASLTTL